MHACTCTHCLCLIHSITHTHACTHVSFTHTHTHTYYAAQTLETDPILVSHHKGIFHGIPCEESDWSQWSLTSVSKEDRHKEPEMFSPKTERPFLGSHILPAECLPPEWVGENGNGYHMLSTYKVRLNAFHCWDEHWHCLHLTDLRLRELSDSPKVGRLRIGRNLSLNPGSLISGPSYYPLHFSASGADIKSQ